MTEVASQILCPLDSNEFCSEFNAQYKAIDIVGIVETNGSVHGLLGILPMLQINIAIYFSTGSGVVLGNEIRYDNKRMYFIESNLRYSVRKKTRFFSLKMFTV